MQARALREKGHLIQIQEDFDATPIPVLASLGLAIYALIPDYRNRCPLCLGRGCAVRHGLYYRRVVDHGQVFDRFPIPRFKCRRKGPIKSPSVTFSILPAELISNHGISLPLATRLLALFLRKDSMADTLDAFAESSSASPDQWFPEPATIYRLVRLGLRAESRLRAGQLTRGPTEPTDRRAQTQALLGHLGWPGRAAPCVLHFHRQHFPRLLFTNAS